jgi:hypothetical protein
MTISEQANAEIIALIAEGESLDPLDLEAFYRWVRAVDEALEFLCDRRCSTNTAAHLVIAPS